MASTVILPRVTPMALTRFPEPFDSADFVFELKYDGFRSIVYFDGEACSLQSRNNHEFRRFPLLCAGLTEALRGHDAILDGEIVCLDREGRPRFNDLLYRRRAPHLAAFDILWQDGRDLRAEPLLERKRILRQIVPPQPSHLLYVSYFENDGVALFEAVCRMDLEGVIAKLKTAPYGPGPKSWIKIKNPRHSQAVGRRERFDSMRARSASAK